MKELCKRIKHVSVGAQKKINNNCNNIWTSVIESWICAVCTYISLPVVMFHAYIWRHGTQTWTKTTSALLHAVYMYIHMLWNLHLWTFKTRMICCCKQGKRTCCVFYKKNSPPPSLIFVISVSSLRVKIHICTRIY